MTPEQQAALIAAWGTVASAVGTIVSAVVAGIAIRAAKQANQTSERSLTFAHEERSAALREAVFEARLQFLQQHSKAISEAPGLVDAYHFAFANYRQYPDSDAKEKEWQAARDELQALRRGLLSALAEATAILPYGYLNAYKALRLDLFRVLNAGNEEVVEKHLANLEEHYSVLLDEGRRMLLTDDLDPQLVAALGKSDTALNVTKEAS